MPSENASTKAILDSYEKAKASFQARYLYALEPLIRASQGDVMRLGTSGLIVEPVETGGAVLVTTDGHFLAAIFDDAARATRPMRMTISDYLFDAVKPPPGVKFFDQGNTFEMPMPEWAQPGEVYAWGLAAYVLGLMPHPSFETEDGGILASISAEKGNVYAGGYRIHRDPPTLPWRRIFAGERRPTASRLNVYPQVLARFDRIERLFREGVEVVVAGDQQPLILTVPGHPEFIGAIMPNSVPIEAPDLSSWIAAASKEPSHAE